VRNSNPKFEPPKFERNPKLEKGMKFKTRLTADSTEFTDAFSTHRILKVAQIFNLPYRRILFC